MKIDSIVRLLKLLSRFTIDPADRIFQDFDGAEQVFGLHIEVILALGSRLQFVQRGQVDRPEFSDLAAQATDLPL